MCNISESCLSCRNVTINFYFAESSEWHLISMEAAQTEHQRPGSNIPFSDVTFTITMKRKMLYPLRLIIMPNLILALMTILVYVVPINSGKRC